MNKLTLGLLGSGLVCSNVPDDKKKAISLGYFCVHHARQDKDKATDLLQRRDTHFLTIPSMDSAKEMTFRHTLSSERLFA
jgi:hypothetical protein